MWEIEPSSMALIANWLTQNAPVFIVGFVAGSMLAIVAFAANLSKLRRDGVI